MLQGDGRDTQHEAGGAIAGQGQCGHAEVSQPWCPLWGVTITATLFSGGILRREICMHLEFWDSFLFMDVGLVQSMASCD